MAGNGIMPIPGSEPTGAQTVMSVPWWRHVGSWVVEGGCGTGGKGQLKGQWVGSLAAAAFLLRLRFTGQPSSLRGGGLVLDTRLGGVQVQASVLNVLVDLLGCLQERVLHILTPGLQENNRLRHNRLTSPLVTSMHSFMQVKTFGCVNLRLCTSL